MQLKGTHDVKLGKSFLNTVNSGESTSNVTNGNHSSYMTMRCDFMPASVDRSQPGSVQVEEGREVVVSLPNTASAGAGSTVFRGSARPVQKECILVFNKRTGELTLEKITHAVQLKKTREERRQPGANVSGVETKPVSTPPSNKQPTGRLKTGTSTGTGSHLTPTMKSRTLSASSSSSCSGDESDGDRVNNPANNVSSAVKTTKRKQKRSQGPDADRKGKQQSKASRSSSASSISSISSSSSSSSSSPDRRNTNNRDGSSSLSSLSDGDTTAENKRRVKDHSGRASRSGDQQFSGSHAEALSTHRNLIEHDLRLSDSDIDSN